MNTTVGIVSALNPVVGYEKAPELAGEAYKSGTGILEIIREKKILSEKQIQELLDPQFLFEGVVIVEGQFGDSSEVVQPLAKGTACIIRGGSQPLKYLLSLFRASERTHEHASVPKVWRHLHVGYRHETNPRILNLAFEDFTQFNSQLFFDTVDASAVHSPYTISMFPVTTHSGALRSDSSSENCSVCRA